MEQRLRLPGERITHLSEAKPGDATHVYGGFIHASICGRQVGGPDGVVGIQKVCEKYNGVVLHRWTSLQSAEAGSSLDEEKH